MVKGRIIIKENPFEEILRSACETLKVECSGSLFGETLERKTSYLWVAESAHPVQLAKRYPNSVIPEEGSLRADWSLLYDWIGGYHLHTTSREQKNGIRRTKHGEATPGLTDKKNLRESQGKIEIITALKRVTTTRKLEHNPRIITGYVEVEGKKYKVEMSGFYCNSRIYKAEIEVPRRVLKLIR